MVLIGNVSADCSVQMADTYRDMSNCERMRVFCTALVDQCSETINGELVWQKQLGYNLCNMEFGYSQGCKDEQFGLASVGDGNEFKVSIEPFSDDDSCDYNTNDLPGRKCNPGEVINLKEEGVYVFDDLPNNPNTLQKRDEGTAPRIRYPPGYAPRQQWAQDVDRRVSTIIGGIISYSTPMNWMLVTARGVFGWMVYRGGGKKLQLSATRSKGRDGNSTASAGTGDG